MQIKSIQKLKNHKNLSQDLVQMPQNHASDITQESTGKIEIQTLEPSSRRYPY